MPSHTTSRCPTRVARDPAASSFCCLLGSRPGSDRSATSRDAPNMVRRLGYSSLIENSTGPNLSDPPTGAMVHTLGESRCPSTKVPLFDCSSRT